MRTLTLPLLLLGMVTLGGGVRAAGETEKVYHVQLVRGSNTDQPGDPKWKPVSARLAKRLSPVFRWKNYWEVDRQVVRLRNDKPVRTVLSNDRALELQLISADVSEIRLYRKGELVRKTRQSAESKFSIMGGDREQGECWFVVVRRESGE